jgi:hypothetical protein
MVGEVSVTLSAIDISQLLVNQKLMEDSEYEKHDKITETTLKAVTKVQSKLDKELQDWEVESTKDGQDSQGN